jgi:hypothetical protein
MRAPFGAVCLVIRYCLIYCLFICLYCLFWVAIVRHRQHWESLRARRSRLWAATSRRARQVTLDHIDHMCFLPLIHILACMIQYCFLSLIPFGIWVHSWLVMLSHAVMSAVQVFHPLWYWVGLCLCKSVMVFHPSRCEVTVCGSMLLFEQRLEWWRWLIPSWHVYSNLLRTES